MRSVRTMALASVVLAAATMVREPSLASPAQSGNNPVDLVQVQLVVPRKVTVGKTFRVVDEVENQGRAIAFQSVTGFFLSDDDKIDETDIPVGGRRVPQLAPGQSHSMTSAVTLKPEIKPGEYYFIAVADARHELEDRSRLDNVRAVPITVVAGKH